MENARSESELEAAPDRVLFFVEKQAKVGGLLGQFQFELRGREVVDAGDVVIVVSEVTCMSAKVQRVMSGSGSDLILGSFLTGVLRGAYVSCLTSDSALRLAVAFSLGSVLIFG